MTLFLAKDPTEAIASCDVEAKHRALAAAGANVVHPPSKRLWGYGMELEDPDGYRVWLWDERTMREKGGR